MIFKRNSVLRHWKQQKAPNCRGSQNDDRLVFKRETVCVALLSTRVESVRKEFDLEAAIVNKSITSVHIDGLYTSSLLSEEDLISIMEQTHHQFNANTDRMRRGCFLVHYNTSQQNELMKNTVTTA